MDASRSVTTGGRRSAEPSGPAREGQTSTRQGHTLVRLARPAGTRAHGRLRPRAVSRWPLNPRTHMPRSARSLETATPAIRAFGSPPASRAGSPEPGPTRTVLPSLSSVTRGTGAARWAGRSRKLRDCAARPISFRCMPRTVKARSCRRSVTRWAGERSPGAEEHEVGLTPSALHEVKLLIATPTTPPDATACPGRARRNHGVPIPR